jgi:hypothetical protein
VTHALEWYDDPRAFLARAGAWLDADPVVTTVVGSVAARAVEDDEAGRPVGDHPRWWVVVEDEGGEVVGVAMRTAPYEPHPVYVLPMPDDAAHELGRVLRERGDGVTAVNGALPAVELVARELAGPGGGIRVHEGMRLHVLDDLAALDEPDRSGRARLATAADDEVVFAWFTAFHHDAALQAGRDPAGETEVFEGSDVQARVEAGRVWLWEDADGHVVSLAAHNPSAGGVVRIGPVFTPPEQRGRGWAGALTAHVTRRILEAGEVACLFTDVENPVSNHVYAAIGYRPVVDTANLMVGA